MADPREMRTKVILMVLISAFLLVFLTLYSTSFLVAKTTKDHAMGIVSDWDDESDAFQYKEFRIFALGFDVNKTICSEEKVINKEKTHYNASLRLEIQKGVHFSSCIIAVGGTIVNSFYHSKFLESDNHGDVFEEGMFISLGKLSVVRKYPVKVCCDNFCNKKTLQALCDNEIKK